MSSRTPIKASWMFTLATGGTAAKTMFLGFHFFDLVTCQFLPVASLKCLFTQVVTL